MGGWLLVVMMMMVMVIGLLLTSAAALVFKGSDKAWMLNVACWSAVANLSFICTIGSSRNRWFSTRFVFQRWFQIARGKHLVFTNKTQCFMATCAMGFFTMTTTTAATAACEYSWQFLGSFSQLSRHGWCGSWALSPFYIVATSTLDARRRWAWYRWCGSNHMVILLLSNVNVSSLCDEQWTRINIPWVHDMALCCHGICHDIWIHNL